MTFHETINGILVHGTQWVRPGFRVTKSVSTLLAKSLAYCLHSGHSTVIYQVMHHGHIVNALVQHMVCTR